MEKLQRLADVRVAQRAEPATFAGAFSLVDCAVIPFAAGLSDMDMEIPAQYPNLRRWLDRARARPSYRTAEVESRFTAVLLRETAAAGQRSA